VTESSSRREFFGTIGGWAMVATLGPVALRRDREPARSTWDESWLARLTARHRAIFDCAEIAGGLAVAHAADWIDALRDVAAATEPDVQAVLIIRHRSIPLALNDAMWAKYPLGENQRLRAPSGEWANVNPHGGSGPAPVRGTVGWLVARRHTVLACDLALRNYGAAIAQGINADPQAVYEDWIRNLLPGSIRVPTGVYAAHRAQAAGATYVRST
jgi:hypothetical protein